MGFAKSSAIALVLAGALAGPALAADPAEVPINSFDESVTSIMKQAQGGLAFHGRYTAFKPVIEQTQLYGGQKALTWTAAVPATMALCYLILIVYFRAIGGYKAEVLTGHAADDEKFTGGTEGPGEG